MDPLLEAKMAATRQWATDQARLCAPPVIPISPPRRVEPVQAPLISLPAAPLPPDFPNEVLAWVFAFVRGPAASGALHESRLVCRRWRDVIDEHARCEPPCEPYISAYRLGYLSPHGLMPLPDPRSGAGGGGGNAVSVERLLGVVAEGAADKHDAALFRAVGGMVDRLLSRDDDAHRRVAVHRILNMREYRIAAGAWEGLTVHDLTHGAHKIHPLDMVRARAMGVAILPQFLEHMFAAHAADESCFVHWTDDELRRAASDTALGRGGARAALWFLRRGWIREPEIKFWLGGILSVYMSTHRPRQSDLDMTLDILTVMEQRGWNSALTHASLLRSGDIPIGHPWATFQRVVPLCAPSERRITWQAHPARFLEQLRLIFRRTRIYTHMQPFDVDAAMDWLLAHGFYQGANANESTSFLIHLVGLAGLHTNDADPALSGENDPVLPMIGWMLARLPRPTVPGVMTAIAALPHAVRTAMLPMVIQYPLPWNSVAVALAATRTDLATSCAFLQALLAGGYRLPLDIAGIEQPSDSTEVRMDEDYRACFLLFEAAIGLGHSLRHIVFDPAFLRQAAQCAEGMKMLGRLDRAGVDVDHTLRHQIYQTTLRGGLETDVATNDERLRGSLQSMLALQLGPDTETLRDLARLYVARVRTTGVVGVTVYRVGVRPSDVAPMQCLVELARTFPDSVAGAHAVTETIAEIGVASVAMAYRAGFPLSPRLEAIFRERGNEAGVAWVRQLAATGAASAALEGNGVDIVDL